jgi:hypothetical protein
MFVAILPCRHLSIRTIPNISSITTFLSSSIGSMALTAAPAALQESIHTPTTTWQANLQSLFKLARERFPDIVWELMGDLDDMSKGPEEVWGCKGRLSLLIV